MLWKRKYLLSYENKYIVQGKRKSIMLLVGAARATRVVWTARIYIVKFWRWAVAWKTGRAGSVAVLLPLVFAAACGSRPTAPEGFYLLSAVDTQPSLIRCHSYERPQVRNFEVITVRFGVTEQGHVVSARAHINPSTMNNMTDELAARLTSAEMAVESCEFVPATLRGRPVAVYDMSMGIVLERRR
jgi:hypothetical protein